MKIRVLGREYSVEIISGTTDTVYFQGDKITVEHFEKQPNELLREFLSDILHDKIREILNQIMSEGYIEIMGPIDIDIVDTIDNKPMRLAKIRKNKIKIKLSTIILPESILRYIIAHEIAHIQKKKHTEKFWATVEKICPTYREEKEKLLNYKQALLEFNKKLIILRK